MGGQGCAAVGARALPRAVVPEAGRGRLNASRWVELGRIGSPYGIRGWVRVQSYMDPPQGLLRLGCLTLRAGTGERSERRLLEGREQGKGLVVLLAGIADRNAAATLRGAFVEIERSKLPPTGERQHYQVDLVGLTVRNLEGVELGVVQYFIEAPTHAVMVVEGGARHFIPATPTHLRKVELERGSMVVDWPHVIE
ncbi:MAG: ribosome maturation factor RimM [Steroidobacteraceae bacterium]